jgi:hypothetical protein
VIFLVLLSTLFGGFLYRHRGGFLPTHHTQLARIDFSLGMAALCGAWTLDPWMALAAVAWMVGCFAPNGDWMGIQNARQIVWGVYSGLINVGPVVVLSAALGHWRLAVSLLVAGALKGPVYLAAKYLPDWQIPQFHRGPEMGEALFGLCLGVAVAI